MATIPTGTTVRLVGLPADHGALCNGNHGVIQGASAFLGTTYYYVKPYLGAQGVFQVPATNVTTTNVTTPPLPLPGVQSGYTYPSHHTAAP
jgi:hypothetical protein